jgi:hypothetical protein
MKTLFTGIFLAVLIFIGCKKAETGPAGPAGSQGATGVGLTGTNAGNITGTITGTRRDGTPFTEPFNYTYYFGGDSGTLDSLGSGMYGFSLSRSTNDIFSNNFASLDITTTSKTAPTGTVSYLYVTFEKSLGTNKMFYFSAYTNTASASSLSYNATTGLFSGNFNVSLIGSQNNTGNTAVISGSFQATIVQMVYIKQQESEIKTN